MKFPASVQQSVRGIKILKDTISVCTGWNLIGSISLPIDVRTVGSDIPRMIVSSFYGYRSGYTPVDTIVPGLAYWVRAMVPGRLILDPSSGNEPCITIVQVNELPPAPPDGAELAVPKEFALHQNYPNPFNPTTSIPFDLPKRDVVTLHIYNVLGQKVLSPVVERSFEAGRYQIRVDGSRLPTGLYFYKFESPSFSASKKMMLIR